jgi:hypothetical protein
MYIIITDILSLISAIDTSVSSITSIYSRITSDGFFLNSRTVDKLSFTGRRMENGLKYFNNFSMTNYNPVGEVECNA